MSEELSQGQLYALDEPKLAASEASYRPIWNDENASTEKEGDNDD